MNGNVVEESPRPRPQSAGIWTLFSWLRRSDQSSSESISSVGSDRTALSFDFLAPLQYGINNPPKILRSSPPTDTYNKRLHERNIRRLRDRGISIHRKYGLFTADDLGYDTLNPNSTYTNRTNFQKNQEGLRERRATSESIHRRAAYVPGKRRAPQPPLPSVAVTLPRSHKRKRPAPKPPTLNSENKENHELNQTFRMNDKPHQADIQTCVKLRVQKSNSNSEHNSSRDKGFLKQIFVNRKRNSAIDTSHIKLLPISELDKQAQEIIERNKVLRSNDPNCYKQQTETNVWICTKCLRRYNATIVSCVYCLPEGKSVTSTNTKRITIDGSNMYTQTETALQGKTAKSVDDKEKLKEMLKEMKDSLPKRSKHEKRLSSSKTIPITETSTLRIGCDFPESSISVNEHQSQNNLNIHISSPKNKEQIKNVEMNAKENFLNSHPMHAPQSAHKDCSQNLSQNKTSVTVMSNINNSPLATSKQTSILLGNVNSNHQLNNASNVMKDKGYVIKQTQEKDTNTPNYQIYQRKENAVEKTNLRLAAVPKSENSQVSLTTAVTFGPNITSTSTVSQAGKSCDKSIVDDKNQVKQIQSNNENAKGSNFNKYMISQSPLKVSSLLNPLYSPKSDKTAKTELHSPKSENITVPTSVLVSPSLLPNVGSIKEIKETSSQTTSLTEKRDAVLNPTTSGPSNGNVIAGNNVENINPYARRRTLITQLEQSISNGDEKTAAEVAAKLAKLRLSCSVLSFSSQIVMDTLNMMNQTDNVNNKSDLKNETGDMVKRQQDNQVKTSMSTTNSIGLAQTKKEITKITSISSDIKNENVKLGEPSTSKVKETDNSVTIEVWVEDKEAARGPICLKISKKANLRDLKQRAATSLDIAIHLQRWIIGKTLCTDEKTPVVALAGPEFTAPFYLCLVEPTDTKKDVKSTIQNHKTDSQASTSSEVYTELINLEKEALVPNSENFECEVCMEERAVGEGVVLRECIHVFCRECLADAVRHCEEPTAACLAVGCSGTLQEREIRALLSPEDYERWLARGLAAAECGTRNTFHCRTTDCSGWAFCEPAVRKFPCPVCKKNNCIPCQAVHEGESCAQYQEKLKKAVSAAERNDTDEGTLAFLNSLISRGEALECPQCKAIITKKWGCDWVKCSACKTEICWVTRGPRWGPAGRGDTSAGCRCGLDGKRCHPTCGYCH